MGHTATRRYAARAAQLALAFLLGAASCATGRAADPAGPPPAAPTQATAAPVAAQPKDDGLHVHGTLGHMDGNDIDEALRGHVPEITACYQDVKARIWYLSGRLTLKLRVAEDGHVRSAAVAESTVGNYQVERCAVQVALRLILPPPRGGEGEFTFPVEFPIRAAVGTWPEERIEPEVVRHRGALLGCRARTRGTAQVRAQHAGGDGSGAGSLRATLYIGPGGKVTSAGLSAEDPIDDRVGACLVARLQSLQFDDPLGQMVKTSIAVN